MNIIDVFEDLRQKTIGAKIAFRMSDKTSAYPAMSRHASMITYDAGHTLYKRNRPMDTERSRARGSRLSQALNHLSPSPPSDWGRRKCAAQVSKLLSIVRFILTSFDSRWLALTSKQLFCQVHWSIIFKNRVKPWSWEMWPKIHAGKPPDIEH